MASRAQLGLSVFHPNAINKYLSRPFQSFDFMKQVPERELAAQARSLGMRFVTDSWHRQLVCWNIAAVQNEFLFYLKMSGGKSKIGIDQIRYRKKLGQLGRAIITVPELIHIDSWEEQFKQHGPDLQYRLLVGNTDERLAQLNKKADVFVINVAGLQPFMTKRVVGKNKNKLQVDDEMGASFAGQFNFVLFDELHRVTQDNLYYAMFHWLAAAADFKYAFSGSAHGRDPTPLFRQFQLIDQGKTFGNNLALFHAALFKPKYNHFAGADWQFDRSKVHALNRMVKNRSITYEVEEYDGLPQKVAIRIPVRLSKEARAYYDRILAGIVESKGDYETLRNSFARQRQCASGFIAFKADDDSRIQVRFEENAKLDALHEFLIARPNEKVLVFHEYRPSGAFIESMLTQASIGFSSLRGGIADTAGEYKRFLTDRKKQVFVLNNQMGAEAINPQYVCRRAVFYESPPDSKRREQAEMRVWRNGQKYTVFIHDLVMQNTVEEKILRYVREGRDLLKAVMTGDETLLPDN